MRDGNNKAYQLFYDMVLSLVVGKYDWKKKCNTIKIQDFVTVSDEAFGLLLLENSWSMWKAAAANGENNNKENNHCTSLYTVNGAGTKKNHGWKIEGLKRFVELVQAVRDNREKDGGKFDAEYLAAKKDDATKCKRKRNGYSNTHDDDDFEMFFENM